jgi:hypothetical protein
VERFLRTVCAADMPSMAAPNCLMAQDRLSHLSRAVAVTGCINPKRAGPASSVVVVVVV